MSSGQIDYTWEEWQASRQARREVSARITPASVRRKSSSSDPKLKKVFDGERGPRFCERIRERSRGAGVKGSRG